MNSGAMDMYQNDPDTCIDDPEEIFQYDIWLLQKQESRNTQTSITQNNNEQLDGGSNFHVFTDINMCTYIRPVNYNVQILNGIKAPKKY